MTGCIRDHSDPTSADVGQLCVDHYARLRSQLVAFPAVARWLHVNLAPASVQLERVSGSREDPIPLRLDVLDLIGPDSRRYVNPPAGAEKPEFLLWEDGVVVGRHDTWRAAASDWTATMRDAGVDPVVVDTLTARLSHDELHERYAEHDGLAAAVEATRTRWQVRPTHRGGWDQAGVDAMRSAAEFWVRLVAADGACEWPAVDWLDLQALVDWLAGRLRWMVEQPWLGEFVADVEAASRSAHRVAPWRAETRREREPCTRCGRSAVVLHIGDGESRCERRAGGCGRRQPLSEYVLAAVLPASRRSA